MKLTIKLERETDGRWIADIPELGVLLYGETKQQAIQAAESAALEIVADWMQHGVLPPTAANPKFAVAA